MRKLTLLLIFFLFISKPVLFAQEVDSVNKKIDSITDIHLKIEFLNEWTGKNYRKLPIEALHYANKTIEFAEESKDYSGAGNAIIRIALIHFRKEDYTQSISFFNKALTKFRISKDSLGINNTYLNRGIVYRNMNKYNLAIVDLFACMEYFEKQNLIQNLSLTYNIIGLVYKCLKEYNKALEYYYKADKIYKEGNQISYLYSSNTNIANILSIQNKFQEALKYYKNNLEILKAKPNKYRLAQTYHNLGSCHMKMQQYPLALKYLNQSLQLKKEIGNKKLIISTLNSLAHVFYEQKKYQKALEYRKKALALAVETQNIEYQKNCNEELSRIYTHLHLADSAIFYLGNYKILRDSLFNLENRKQIAEIQEKYESEKKESQIAVLEKENKNRMWQRNSLVVLLFLLLGYAIFIVRSYYRDKKTNRLLQVQKSRIEWHKTLLDRKNEALLESNHTKNRLFQIISHDLRSPLASVYNISQLIKIFIQQKKYDLIEEASDDMEHCVDSVLNLTDNLLSWSLNQSGRLPYKPVILPIKPLLENNLQTYASVAKQKNIHLQQLLQEDLYVFADRQMLDTVVRNLINNSLKFTPTGGIIVIGAKQKEDFIEVWIKDSGIGMSEEQIEHLFEVDQSKSHVGTRGEKGNGLGLILCKQFIERNKGEIQVESHPNNGSTFRFTVPAGENTSEITSILSSNLHSN